MTGYWEVRPPSESPLLEVSLYICIHEYFRLEWFFAGRCKVQIQCRNPYMWTPYNYVDTLRSEHIFHPGLHETEVTSSGPGVQRAALPYMEIKTP